MFRAVYGSPEAWLNRLFRQRTWFLLIGIVSFVFVVRVRLLNMPLERDEGEYAYAGQLILQGVPPYKMAYNMKLPGTYAAYALIMAVFGQSPAGIHLGLLLVNCASIVLVFLIGRRLLDEVAGLAAAVSFAILSLSPSVRGLAGHATHFVVLPALGGILLLLEGQEITRPRTFGHGPPRVGLVAVQYRHSTLFFSGLLFGIAILMKQQGIFFGLFGLIFLFSAQVWGLFARMKERARFGPRRRAMAKSRRQAHAPQALPADRPTLIAAGRQSQQTLLHAGPSPTAVTASTNSSGNPPAASQNPGAGPTPTSAPSQVSAGRQTSGTRQSNSPIITWTVLMKQTEIFTVGLVLPYLITCVVLWGAGAFHQFWFWTFTYALEYATAVPLATGLTFLPAAVESAVGPNALLWLLAGIGAILILWEKRLTVNRRFYLILFLVCSAATTAVGFYFRRHYFITLLPALSLLLGIAVSRSMTWFKTKRGLEQAVGVPIPILFFIGLAVAFVGDGAVWFGLSPKDAVREIYSTTLFDEAAKMGQFIRTRTPKSARIAVLGSEPEIYFLSHRRAATGHIYTYPLMERQRFALQMQEEMIAEIETNRPEYVVYVDHELSWLQGPDSNTRIFDWWRAYWADHLELVRDVRIEGRLDSNFLRSPVDKNHLVAPSEEQAQLLVPPSVPRHLLLFKRKSSAEH